MQRNLISALVSLVLAPVSTWAATTAGEIIAFNGKTEYQENVGTPWQAARIKQPIVADSLIKTGEMSSASLLLIDNAQVKLGQNTLFKVAKIAPGNAPSQPKTQLNLLKGRVWAQIKQPLNGLTINTPTVAAGIHGTDWVIDVDDIGNTTLTVLSGVIELSNAYGSLDVKAGEEGSVEVGKAPTKRTLVNAQERVQWVGDYKLDTSRYPELASPAFAEAAKLLNDNQRGAALAYFTRQCSQAPSPLAWLMSAELELARGDAAAAAVLLQNGRERYPADPRFAALQVRTELYRDKTAVALAIAQQLTREHASFTDGWLALGEAARLAGDGATARQAYQQANRLAPNDPRGWLGLGIVELERDASRDAKAALSTARQIAGRPDYAAGEFGTLFTYGDQANAARAEYAQALTSDAADYVALTGSGLAALKAGDNDGALDHLLRANAIEPKYARAVAWLAVAYYRVGKSKAARDTLDRAALLDANDPLPLVLRAMIERDERNTTAALNAARAAAERMPKLKSLNQVASDQQGSGNIGAALSDMGLDAWANHYAQSAYYPFFASSHLFLADRYSGSYNKTSELIQGFLVDPTVFGADPRRNNLVVNPGVFGQLSASYLSSQSLRLQQLVATANGYNNSASPFAWFGQIWNAKLQPKDSSDRVDADNGVLALGSKLTPELSVFAYGSRLQATANLLGLENDGTDSRIETGASYRFGPQSTLWLKLGWNRQDGLQTDRNGPPGMAGISRLLPEQHDIALRHTFRTEGQTEISYGAAFARRDNEATLQQGTTNRFEGSDTQKDRSSTLWLQIRQPITPQWRVDAGLTWQDYQKEHQTLSQLVTPIGTALLDEGSETLTQRKFYPRIGLAYTPSTAFALRAAYQHWQRPYVDSSLQPITTADLPLQDKLVLPGGEQKQWRIQADWEISPSAFVSAFYQRVESKNLMSDINGEVLNQPKGVSQLDALLGSRLFDPSQLDGVAVIPIFSQGVVRQTGLQFNALINDHLAVYTNLIYNQTANSSETFNGLRLPGIRERNALLGVRYANETWTFNAETLYGSDYADRESSGVLGLIDPARQHALRASWRSPDRRWLLQGFVRRMVGGTNETISGLKGDFRF